MNTYFLRGAATVELALVLPILMIFLVVGFDFSRTVHARNTLANAIYVATTIGWSNYFSHEENWKRTENKSVIVHADILAAMNNAFNLNLAGYPLIDPGVSPSGYLCQCIDLATTIVACDTASIKSCADGNLKIYLTVSKSIDFHTVINLPSIPSIISIGPLSATSRVK